MFSTLKIIYVLIFLIPITLVLLPLQIILAWLLPHRSRSIPLLWHKVLLWLIGVRVFTHGRMAKERPLMLVANHVSWADIVVLGSIGQLCFIAKDDVKSIPGINWLARLQRTVFVNRTRKTDTGIQADTIASRLLSGDVMVLFAEGTTGNGDRLLPFKSALFGAPQMALQQSNLEEIAIQPVAITYNSLHGMPLGRYHQTIASWPGDILLGPHLKTFIAQGAFDVDVSFGDCLSITQTTKRKEIASKAFENTRNMFTRLRRLYHHNT